MAVIRRVFIQIDQILLYLRHWLVLFIVGYIKCLARALSCFMNELCSTTAAQLGINLLSYVKHFPSLWFLTWSHVM